MVTVYIDKDEWYPYLCGGLVKEEWIRHKGIEVSQETWERWEKAKQEFEAWQEEMTEAAGDDAL